MAALADIFKHIFNSGQSHRVTELRIVLIGESNSKANGTIGNFILGQDVFDTSRRTAQSEAKQQEVLGRRVTVVDTPGCWWHYPSEDTAKLDLIEIQNSVHLCPPGPHVFLLVIPVDLYLPHRVKSSLKDHLELFNADVFSHTIVLFTAVDPFSDEKVESKIRRSPTLQWLLQQCGNRKHVLNISNRQDRDQVKMLLEKIESMVTNNGGRHCSVDRSQGEALRKEMIDLAKRASRRFDQVQKQRRKLKKLIEGGKLPPSHLRMVLVGAEWEGKSSAGNTILGKQEFHVNENGSRTAHSEVNHGVVEGRRLTVIDSPGWFYINTLQDTSEMEKLEIENSVYLCPPGPHAVLLVISLATALNVSSLTAVHEHMNLLGEDVWKHTLILFTRGDWLGVKTVEEHIESEEGLQWIVNKCGNRYHVLNNMDHSDKTQVKELLEKIEEMWAGNEDPCYEVDLDRAALIEAKKEAGDKMAKRLKTINERQLRVLKELFEGERRPVTEMRICLVGQKCSGKSKAGNIILHNEMFDKVFDTARLKKDYQDQRESSTCVKHEGDVDGVKVSVVETPGWFSDPTPPDWIKDEVLHSVSMCSPGPHVFLLVVPISRAFTEKDLKALVEVLMPLTERVWRHCMVLFTWGDWINDLPVENYIASEGKELQELLEKCRNRYHVLNPYLSDNPVQVKELFQKIIDMVTQNKECFTTEGQQISFLEKFSFFFGSKKQMEEEWKKREEELIGRMLRALAKEPEEPTVPHARMAHSMVSGDVASEFASGSEYLKQTDDFIATWLRRREDEPDSSSGTSNISSFSLED